MQRDSFQHGAIHYLPSGRTFISSHALENGTLCFVRSAAGNYQERNPNNDVDVARHLCGSEFSDWKSPPRWGVCVLPVGLGHSCPGALVTSEIGASFKIGEANHPSRKRHRTGRMNTCFSFKYFI